ncbi:trypsin delta-like [Drosophila subpulchrella]|uniref:trypsin delta-like n=1 Tax=Drosophila subpulchrella TaxID=1486046 RepID=UPI0018A198EC|nr:trypsin delta-like [Drosophila subpulchrella]
MLLKYLTLLLGSALLCEGRVLQVDQRIIGGFPVTIETVPWQVYLKMKVTNDFGKDGYLACGGVIYKEDIILTAAHCIENIATDDISVYFGSSKNASGELVKVSKAISHEDYNGVHYSYAYDIAVLVLSSPIPLGDNASTIEIADETPEAGTPAVITGWGQTDANDKNSTSNTLLGTFATIQDQQSCRELYSFAGYFITDSMICAKNFGSGVCHGDSGGPLVNSNAELIGLASWNLGCDKPYVPEIYTNVVVFKDWILRAANIIV